MTRDSIHISMSEPLRRAQVRPRLAKLASATGLPAALVAARALVHGLAYIEGDLSRLFPAAAAPSAPIDETTTTTEPPRNTSTANDPPETTRLRNAVLMPPAPPCYPPPDPEQVANDHDTAAPTSTAQPLAAQQNGMPEPAPRALPATLITTAAAARALKLSKPALQQRLHRNPELRRHRHMDGRSAMWDLPGLRAALAK